MARLAFMPANQASAEEWALMTVTAIAVGLLVAFIRLARIERHNRGVRKLARELDAIKNSIPESMREIYTRRDR